MKRGEVWTIAGGPDYIGKPRPAVVIQGDYTDFSSSATVCPVTTDSEKAPDRPKVERNGRNGLFASSYLMVDKIATLPQSKVGQKIGKLDEADMAVLNREILDFLGFRNLVALAG